VAAAAAPNAKLPAVGAVKLGGCGVATGVVDAARLNEPADGATPNNDAKNTQLKSLQVENQHPVTK